MEEEAGNPETNSVEKSSEIPARLELVFGTIDQVEADALVCPQKTFNDPDSLERQLLEIKYGKKPFETARRTEEEYIVNLRKAGETGKIQLLPGYSVATPVEKEGSGVKKIIHTNIAEKEGVSDAVRLAIGNALEEGAKDPNIKTVAIPLFGNINTQTLRPRIFSIVEGIKDYFEERPDSTIERAILVINADETTANKQQINRILSSL